MGDAEFELRTQLLRIASQDGIASTTAEFAKGLVHLRHSTIYYPPPLSTSKKDTERSPDCSWAYDDMVDYPSCIIEVANSQTTKNLTKLAQDYIFGTGAAVRTVVGFDFYRRSKKATMSIWRPKLNDEGILTGTVCEVVQIRHEDGQRNQDEGAGLRLSLEDFAFCRPAGTFDGLDQVSLFIPVSRLCDMLEHAEEHQRKSNARKVIKSRISLPPRPNSRRPTQQYSLRALSQIHQQ